MSDKNLPDNIKHLGQFKLKDKRGRNDVKVDLGDGRFLHIVKIPNANNRFRLFLEEVREDAGKSNSN